MPSLAHEELVELFRLAPELAVELLRGARRIPEFDRIEVKPADLTELIPISYRADVLVLLVRDVPVFAIIVEVQLRRDADKRLVWPLYVTAAHARYRCPACLVVYAPSESLAEWCAEPIDYGQPGSPFVPVVRQPSAITKVTDPAEAVEHPHRAVLSALAHGAEKDALEMAQAAILGLAGLPEDERTAWETAILDALNEAARVALVEWMDLQKFPVERLWPYKKGFAKGQSEGEAKALLRILERRGIEVPEETREQILACGDTAQLEAWIDQAIVANNLEEVMQPARGAKRRATGAGRQRRK